MNKKLMIDKYIKNLWLWKCGMPEERLNMNDLYKTEWSSEFERLMRNRLVMGAYRYGRLQPGKKPRYDRIKEMKRRIELYVKTGNQEYLIDIANFAMCEFIEPSRSVYLRAIDDGEHAEVLKK